MKNLAAEHAKITAAILSLGLSYVRPSLDQDEEERNQQINESNSTFEESTEEESSGFTDNMEYSNEEEIKILGNNFDENIQESDNEIQALSDIEKLYNVEKSKEENVYKKAKRKKFNEMSLKSSEKYVKMFRENYKMENEVTSKSFKNTQLKHDIGVHKEIINEKWVKVNESNNIDGKEYKEEKQQKFNNHTKELISKLKCEQPRDTDSSKQLFTHVFKYNGSNQHVEKHIKLKCDGEIQLESYEKVLEKVDKEKLQKPQENAIIEMEVDSEFQKKLDCEVEKEMIKEKHLIPEGIEINVASKYQNESEDKNIQEELIGNQKLFDDDNEKNEKIKLYLEMEVDPELYQQHGDINLQLYLQFIDDLKSQNDVDDKFEEELREKHKMSGIEIKVNNCVGVVHDLQPESCGKIQQAFDKDKSKRDETVGSVEKRQQKLNLERHNESNNEKLQSIERIVQEKSNKNNESFKEKQKVLVDTQQKMNEKKPNHSGMEHAINKTSYEKVQEEFEELDIHKAETLSPDELQRRIEEVQRKMYYLEQEIDEESEKKIIKEINKISTPEVQLKLLKHCYFSLDKKLTSVEDRVKQISKDYFPPELVLIGQNKDNKKEVEEFFQNIENTFILNDDEVQTESKRKVPMDLDLNCDGVESNMQEELDYEVGERSNEEFKVNLEEKKLDDSDVNCKDNIQEELGDVRQEELSDEMQENSGEELEEILEKEKQEDSNLDIEGTIQENYKELQENSDIADEIQEDFEDKLDDVHEDRKSESDEEDSFIDVEGFSDEEIQQEFNIHSVPEIVGESSQESEEESEEHFGDIVDINIVTEILEDYIVEKCEQDGNPVAESTLTEKECSVLDQSSIAAKELQSSSEELNATKKKKKINKKVKQKNFNQGQVKFDENVQELKNETQGHNFEKMKQEFKIFLENMQDLDEIPQELKIEQEQIDNKLFQRFREFQEYFYNTFKQEYDKGKKIHNSDLSTFNEQQKTFYKLKDELNKIKEDYKSFVLQKFLEDQQQKIGEVNLQDIEEFPKELNDNLCPQIDEIIQKEFDELELEFYGMEPEFKYNIPLEFEVDNSSKHNKKKKLKKKPFDLFKKLYSIHQKLLREFAESTEWPQNCLYPAGLLDHLFEDPSEDKPNVLVIMLYPIDIGFSIKISMNINEPPIEMFFNYVTDSAILSYIENEKIPPDLLDLLDRAEPGIFHSGCVIAEIYDQTEKPHRLIRLLLRPSNETILRDVNRIIAENSSLNWTYDAKLRLESVLIQGTNANMCLDILPVSGLAVQLQNQLLTRESICLNPIRNSPTFSKLNKLEKDDLNDDMFSSKVTNELKSESSEIIDSASKEVHKILWKFVFRVGTINVIKLYILCITEIQDFSLLLCMNSEFESDVIMRVKINLETNKLNPYISMILDILKQRINPDIDVFRRYKSDEKSTNRYLSCVPRLFNNKIYEPSHSDISEMIDTFLEIKSSNEDDKIKSPTMPINLSDDYSTDQTRNNSRENVKVNQNNEQNINLLYTNHSSEKQDFEMFNINLRGQELNSTSEILPTSISATELSSATNPIEIMPKLSSHLPITSESGSTTILPPELSLTDITPSVSNPVTVISLLPSLINVISSVPSHITVVSSTTTSKVSSSETTSIEGIPAPTHLSTFEDHNVNITAELKPINIPLSNTDHLENLNKNYYDNIKLLDNVEHQLQTIYDMKTTSDTNVTQSLSSQSEGKTKLIKHVHGNGICLKRVFPNHTVNMKAVPQKSILLQRNIPVDQTTSSPQLDNNIILPKFTDLEHTSNFEVSTVTRHLSEDVFNEYQRLFEETSSSSNNLTNENAFQETNITESSNTENSKGLMRNTT